MVQLPVKVRKSNAEIFTAIILGEYHVDGNTMYLAQDLKTKKTVRFSPDEIEEILVQVSSHVITNPRNG